MTPASGPGRIRRLPPWVRLTSVAIRSGHVVLAALYLGYLWLAPTDPARLPFFFGAAATGVALLVVEAWGHPDLWRQASGWLVVVKVTLVMAAPRLPAQGAGLVVAAFLVAGVGAHLPKAWRHRRLF